MNRDRVVPSEPTFALDLRAFLRKIVKEKRINLVELVNIARNSRDKSLDALLEIDENVPEPLSEQELVEYASKNDLEPLGVLLLRKTVVLNEKDFVRAEFRARAQANFPTERKRTVIKVSVSRGDDGEPDEGYDYRPVCDDDLTNLNDFVLEEQNFTNTISNLILDRAKLDMNIKFVRE